MKELDKPNERRRRHGIEYGKTGKTSSRQKEMEGISKRSIGALKTYKKSEDKDEKVRKQI